MVMYAPGGIASLIMMNVRVAAYRKLHQLWGWYAALAATAAILLAGLAALIELIYHLQLEAGTGSQLRYLGLTLDTQALSSWLGALAVALVGAALFELVRRRFMAVWGRVQSEIEEAMTFKEPDAAAPLGGKAAAREASLGAP
jgi:branched-chain amino acid transport system permease protein